jgi:putative hemolysin
MPSSKNAIEAAVQRAMFGLLGIDKLFAVCKALPPGTPETFAARYVKAMNVKAEWSGQPLDTIPATGPLIVVANHPFGLVEGLALDAMLLERRPDVTFIAWHSVADIPGIGRRYIFVDPQRLPETRKRNVAAWRQAFAWIERGGVLGVFPAGRVARFDWSRMAVADWPWTPHVARIARRSKVPVLPVFFHGRNSLGFLLAGMVMPTLHQSLVVREANNKRGRTLRGTVGAVIQPEELAGFASDEEAIAFLRSRTEALACPNEAELTAPER